MQKTLIFDLEFHLILCLSY